MLKALYPTVQHLVRKLDSQHDINFVFQNLRLTSCFQTEETRFSSRPLTLDISLPTGKPPPFSKNTLDQGRAKPDWTSPDLSCLRKQYPRRIISYLPKLGLSLCFDHQKRQQRDLVL
jgi:hypothetical protein